MSVRSVWTLSGRGADAGMCPWRRGLMVLALTVLGNAVEGGVVRFSTFVVIMFANGP